MSGNFDEKREGMMNRVWERLPGWPGLGLPTRLADAIVVKAAESLCGQMENVWHEVRVCAPGSVRKGERREEEGRPGPQATAWECSPPAPPLLPAFTA